MTLAERLRQSLIRGSPVELIERDIEEDLTAEWRDAAVLVPITAREEPGLLLTVRTAGLRLHAGQIAFPGGRVDPGDADVTAAALREAWEELGIDPAIVDVAGTSDPYRTVTGYHVTPVVGVVPPDLDLTPHEGEVAEWFEVPLAHVLDPANHHRLQASYRGVTRDYYEIPWHNRQIWGATAAMLINLSRRLAWN